MDYTGILKRAVELAWHNRWLWLLALLAGEGSTGGSLNFRGTANAPGRRAGSNPDAAAVLRWAGDHLPLLLGLVAVAVVVFLVLALVSVVAEGGAVRGAAALDAGERAGLGWAWRAGSQVFWPMLGMRLLVFVLALAAFLVAGVLVGLAVFAGIGAHAPGAVALLAWQAAGYFVLLFLLALVVPTIVKLASRAIALDSEGGVGGLRSALALARRRLGPVAALWGIELVCAIGAGIAFAIVTLTLGVPLAIGAYAAISRGSAGGVVAVAVFGVLLVVALLVALAAISAFFSAYWTVAYRRLVTRP